MARDTFNTSDAQKSEVHDTTADADGSPTASGDALTTRRIGKEKETVHPQREPAHLTAETTVVRDETDVGGPLVIKSDDPGLNPPQVPQDAFPTDGTPEVDPKIEN